VLHVDDFILVFEKAEEDGVDDLKPLVLERGKAEKLDEEGESMWRRKFSARCEKELIRMIRARFYHAIHHIGSRYKPTMRNICSPLENKGGQQ